MQIIVVRPPKVLRGILTVSYTHLMNSKRWTAFAIVYQTGFAYLVSMCIYQIGTFIAGGSFGIFTAISVITVLIFLYMLFRKQKA